MVSLALVCLFELCVLFFQDFDLFVNYFARLVTIFTHTHVCVCVCVCVCACVFANLLILKVHLFLFYYLLQPRQIFKIMKIHHPFYLGLLLQMA